jgi:thiamine-monophosphate kinase
MPAPSPAVPGEADVIRWLTPAASRPDVAVGIGDDGAVLAPTPGQALVVVTDALVAGTHFPPDLPPDAVGHRALAVNLSDLAAMGAVPRWATLALSLPAVDAAWVAAFAAGFHALAARSGVVLVGGDTVRGPLFAVVTAGGELPPGAAVRRSGARPGDAVYVTGHPGDAVAGRLLAATARGPAADYLRHRFRYPEPRLATGGALRGLATAMLDVSDGLDQDLARLAAASGVGFVLDVDRLPLSAELRAAAGDAARGHALTGGDDYELAFTAPADVGGQVLALATPSCPVTCIGRVAAGSGVRWQSGGRDVAVPAGAWQHFGPAP